jgi:SAM-dependent methyltransferase
MSHGTGSPAPTAAPDRVYGSVNRAVLDRVPHHARRVLDVGCGNGLFGQALKAERGCTVVGVTYSRAEAEAARAVLDQVVLRDLADGSFDDLAWFDCVVCSHVLEHLPRPADTLARLRRAHAPGGVLVVALPNVVFWRQRLQFLRGRFRYTDGGIMDDTHLRFFDWDGARALVTGAGYELVESAADGGFPGSRFLGAAGPPLDRRALAAFPGLFGTQFLIVARPAADR